VLLFGSGGLTMSSWFECGNGLGSARGIFRVTFVLCGLSLVRDLGWDGAAGFFLSRRVILDGTTVGEDDGFMLGSGGRGENNDGSIASMRFRM